MTGQATHTQVANRISVNRLDRLRVRHLKLLELVATAGSLTAAANALHISQPSATKMLQELELVFGRTLVDRTTRGGTLSDAGERALERLRIATGALDALGQALASQAELPLVRIGMLPLAGVSLVPRLVGTLSVKSQLPRLQLIDGSVSSVLAMLRQGQIDCVIGRAETNNTHGDGDEFDIVPLTDERFEVACGRNNPLVRTRKLGLPRLRDQIWVLPPPHYLYPKGFRCGLRELGPVATAAAYRNPVLPYQLGDGRRKRPADDRTPQCRGLLCRAWQGAQAEFDVSVPGRLRRVHHTEEHGQAACAATDPDHLAATDRMNSCVCSGSDSVRHHTNSR